MKLAYCLSRYSYLTIKRKPFALLEEDDIAFFRSVLPQRNVVTDQQNIAPHNLCFRKLDMGHSKLLLLPSTTAQVSQILQYCNNRKLAVVPQGGNTGLVGGSVPVFDEIIVNLKHMDRIVSFNDVSAVVTCEAGVILEKLNAHLNCYGFEVPLDLGAKGSCQIGGNASTNAGGKYVIKYGSFRSHILGLQAVLPDGRILDLRSEIQKDNTGYDLKQLFISGEGTLGVITKLNILCEKADQNKRIMVLKADNYNTVLSSLPILRRVVGKHLNALEYLDGFTYRIVSKYVNVELFDKVSDTDHLLFVELTTDDIEQIVCALPEYGDSLISDNSQQFSSIWRVREEVSIAATKKSTKVLAYDISYDVKEWPNIVDDIRKETRAPVLGYGHIGDGNLHINICLTEDQSFDDESLFKEVTSKQGSISAEHGVGLRKKQYLHLQKSGVAIEMFRKIKEVFDPHGIMNPYKVIPDA